MLEELKTFTAVVETKNFTKAAKQINLSQPSVSVHIKNLEAYFNTELVSRSSKQKAIIITDSGKLLYRRSKEILSLLEITKDELHSIASSLKGHVRIGATLTIGECLLPHFLGKFCKSYPDIEVEIFIGNTTEVTTMLKELKLDIAFVEGNNHSSHFIHQYFLDDPLVLLAPKHLGLSSPLSDLSLLQNQRWLVREHGSGLRETLDFFFSNHHIVPQSKVIFNSNLALLQAAKNNIGVAFISKYMLAAQPTCLKNLDIIELDESIYLSFSYILAKELRLSKVTQLLINEFSAFIEALHTPSITS